ncbi:MAG: sulfotransferase domain-containing protein [Pseudomonadota bacterium]
MSNLRRIIWLASYPKSGNTWMRSLLAHYFMPAGEAPDINNLRQFTTADVRQDFFDAANGAPFSSVEMDAWLRVRPKALALIAGSKPGTHFVKTHCQAVQFHGQDLIPPALTAGAIYMLRNPFDLAPSFARHQSSDLDTAIDRMTNPDTIMGTPTGIRDALGRWDDHVRSWTEAPGLPRHVVRYEDMLDRAPKMVRDLLEFLSIKPDSAKLARAIKATSFENLKKQEEDLGFTERPDGMERFFAKGESGVWRDELTPEQVGRIRTAFLPTLERWYPELLEETEEFSAAG